MPVAIAANNDMQGFNSLSKTYLPNYSVTGPCLELETVESPDGKSYKIELVPVKKK